MISGLHWKNDRTTSTLGTSLYGGVPAVFLSCQENHTVSRLLEDISDIPVVGGDSDTDGYDEIEAELQLLAEDDEPLPQQLELAKTGGWLAPPISKLPIADQFAGKKVELIRFSGDASESSSRLAAYSVDGFNDPVVQRVLKKYALADGEVRTMVEHNRALTSAMQEIARIKKAQALEAAIPRTAVRKHQEATNVEKKRVEAVFNFGGVDGARRARYSGASVDGSLLVLIADDELVASGVWEPPDLGPEVKFEVTLSNMPEPLRVFSCGLRHSHEGKIFYLLFIDR